MLKRDYYDYIDYEDYEPELPEYVKTIEETIEAEAERRVAKKVSDIDELRAQQSKYADSVSELKKEMSEAQQEVIRLKQQLSTVKRNAEKQIEEIKTKTIEDYFDGWDKCEYIYYLKDYSARIKCPICKNTEKLKKIVDGFEVNIECPLCKKRLMCAEYQVYNVESSYKPNLLIGKDNKKIKIYFTIGCYNTRVMIENCYRTKKEAQEKADELTKISREKAEKAIAEIIERNGWDKLIDENSNEQ